MINLVGWKGANLGEMTKAWFPVPRWFCITTEAYKMLLSQSWELSSCISELEGTKKDSWEEILKISGKIRNLIKNLSIQKDLKESILESWKAIWEEKSYAIRSSATAEDLPSASFAWQQDTYLNIKGEKEILESIRNCWASLFTDRAVSYRIKNNFKQSSIFLSVIVQEMVFSDVSGIMFTADPITGKRKAITINSSFGLWEALVGWLVSSDTYKVIGWIIAEKNISQKKIEIIPDADGWTCEREIGLDRQNIQSLTDEQILELAALGSKIENHYKSEQDIEWCLKDGEFYIVQSRPITTIYPLPENMMEWLHFFVSFWHVQMMTEPMKALWISIFKTLSSHIEEFFEMKHPLFVDAWSRLYVDLINPLQYWIFQKIIPLLLMNADETASKILFDFIRSDRFKIVWKKEIALRKKWIIFKFMFQELMLFFSENLNDTYPILNNNISNRINAIRKELSETPSREKIWKIKSIINDLPEDIFISRIVQYMPLSILSYKLLWILSKKWLGETALVDQIWKAPFGNVTTEMWLILGDLSDKARDNALLQEYLRKAEDKDFWEKLENIQWSSEFRESLMDFFKKYGMRCTWEIDITHPRWNEQPTQVTSIISNILKNQERWQHRRDFGSAREEALRASEKLLARIRQTPFGTLKALLLRKLIFVYRSIIWVREHPKFFLINVFASIKEVILEETKFLIEENKLESADDISYFSLDEISRIIETWAVDADLLAARKAKYNSDKDLKPPRVFDWDWEILTIRPDENMPLWAFVWTPASPGVVEWRARVIRRLEDADLQKWDILVTAYTDPAWTVLFSIASAIVTEVGWLLTHWSVVAREYGIPAVVGVDDATSLIKDGDFIRVNWNGWFVEIL